MNILNKLKVLRLRRYIACRLMRYFPNFAVLLAKDTSMIIEVTSRCNLKCLCCPVGNGKIESENMSLEYFKQIVDMLPKRVKNLTYSHRGDPTMNPELSKMIRYAYDNGIRSDVFTNGLILDQHIDELVHSGIYQIRIDLDGANEDSYMAYRKGSDFHRVKENIRKLVEARECSSTGFPKIIGLLCVVTSFNEHEIEDIQNQAKDLGVDRVYF